jgi:curved DNA-binding protein CbpA
VIDYYVVLNIKPTASKKEIKEAFKTEAFKWHPDRNNSSDATARMQLINEAYLILKDDEARARYDKQYYKFQDAKEKKDSNQEKSEWHDYSIDDDILNDWIKKAKRQAKEMVIMSLEDLVGMSKVATNAAWDKTKYAILIVVVANILFMLLMR